MHMSKWNIASSSKEEQDKVSVGETVTTVTWQERMDKPVMPKLAEWKQSERLRQYFQQRLEVHRQNSQQLPCANAPEHNKPGDEQQR